jgi:hypothetical protein
MSKIIDFERKGNVVRFYLGADDCSDYWGDDWNDAPYDCNAGTVYDEYVTGVKDVAFPFDSLVLEPSSESYGASRYFSKEDMKKRVTPCIIVVPKDVHGEKWAYGFDDWIGADNIKKIYFGDPAEVLDND